MIELDGVQYQVESAESNADAIFRYANEYANEKQLRDREGDLIQFEKNWTNPLYLIAYGAGVLFSYVQRLVYSAACGLNLAESSERQLMNIADIAGVKRREASVTTINAVAFSTTGGECQISTTDVGTIMTTEGPVDFAPAYDVTIPANSSAVIILIAQQAGSFAIEANTFSFTTPPTNLRLLSSSASVPGLEEESIANFRRRLARRGQSNSNQDEAASDIGSLAGVSSCSIIFNPSITDNLVVHDVTIPPRQAALYVQGYNAGIAEAYYRHMTCGTATSTNAFVQTYTGVNGQAFTVNVIPPIQQPVYIRIYAREDLSDVEKSNTKDTVLAMAATQQVGQMLSSTEVIDALQAAYGDKHWDGCSLSLDGSSYSYKVSPASDTLLTFSAGNIEVFTE